MNPEEDIRRLLARYPLVHDKRDAKNYALLFAKNAHFGSSNSRSDPVGREAIEAFIASRYALKPVGERTKHFYGNQLIEVHGDTADVTSDLIIYSSMNDGPWTAKWVGQTIDRLVFEDGQWLIADRRNIDSRWSVEEQTRRVEQTKQALATRN